MIEKILGTIRPAFSAAYASIGAGASEPKTDKLRDGDKYDYYVDGIAVVADTITNPSKLLIDFSTIGELKEDLLQNFPYSLRGSRNNPIYIPLTKTSRTDEMPLIPKGKQFYYKLFNNDGVNPVTGVAIAIWAYPVFSD